MRSGGLKVAAPLLLRKRGYEMAVITKKEFVDKVYEKLKEQDKFVPKHTVYWTNKAFIDCMLDVLRNGDELNIHQTFILKHKYLNE